MIGNDVVDILQSRIESNWQRPRFLEKIFTDDEQLLIENSHKPEFMVWLLWSMKEAAYKIYNRETKIRKYIPKKLMCTVTFQNAVSSTGQVKCFDFVYYTKTVITIDFIHTVAVRYLNNLNDIVEVKNHKIVKDEYGIPYLLDSIKNKYHDVSISNHGRYEKVVIIDSI
jgi:phosphopantetheinyl transferase (holo-ACP synthase)